MKYRMRQDLVSLQRMCGDNYKLYEQNVLVFVPEKDRWESVDYGNPSQNNAVTYLDFDSVEEAAAHIHEHKEIPTGISFIVAPFGKNIVIRKE